MIQNGGGMWIDHLVLTVRDLDATARFYRDLLGMDEVIFAEGRRALRFGCQKFNLHPFGSEFEPKADQPTPGSVDLCLLSEIPISHWVQRCRAAGVAVLEGPVARTGAVGSIRSIYVRDPDLNLVEISNLEPVGHLPDGFTLVSGGQTGVDRGALDAALALGLPASGWCPPGRLAEDGPIPDRYPLREMASGGYAERTRQNVVDSDATLILYRDRLEGGTAKTVIHCAQVGKMVKLIDSDLATPVSAAIAIRAFIVGARILRLNVAGPRASKEPGATAYTRALLMAALGPAGGGDT